MTENEYTMTGVRYRPSYGRNGLKVPRSTAAVLDSVGESVLASVKAKIAKFDPNGTALKFAFITDLHRSEEGVYASNAIDDRYSLRLLSRLCDEVDLDAVFVGGDTANGRSENAQYTSKNMQDVASDLDDLLPSTSVFATIGNHDKRYASSNTLITNEWLGDLYDHIQTDGNGIELHYIDDTNFYLDFTKHKVRIIFVNQYDAVDSDASWYANESTSFGNGIPTHGTTAWTSALNIANKQNWLVGVVFHGADTGAAGTSNPDRITTAFPVLQNNLDSYLTGGGKGVIGVFAGHYHLAKSMTVLPRLNVVHVSNAYAQQSQIGSAAAYCFSIIVLDSSTGLFHEIRVGRDATEIPFCAFTNSASGGLLLNGTHDCTGAIVLIYGGNHVRFDARINAYLTNFNLTNPRLNHVQSGHDAMSEDTSTVLFSAASGDVIKTEVKISSDSGTTNRSLKIFSPQIADMAVGNVVSGATITKEITLDSAVNVTAVGMFYGGQTPDSSLENQVLDFELNIYKNGVRVVRQG